MPKKSNTRQAQGSGTIRQRPDGRWEARYTVGRDPGTGKQIQKSIYGSTQKEVRQRLQQINVDMDAGKYIAPSAMTIEQWTLAWLEEYLGDTKHTTQISYRQTVKNHIIPALGKTKLQALTPVMVQRFYNQLQKAGLSAKTVKNVHGVLHQALKQAQKIGYIRSNPSEACTLPRTEKKEMQPLDAPEIKAFLQTIEGEKHETLFKVALFTGMREGELLGLQWSCVDFDRGLIIVNKQLARPRVKGDVYRFAPLKNDKPRTIKPAPYVMEILRAHRSEQIAERLRLGVVWDDGGFPDLVFTEDTGGHLCYTVVLRHFQRAIEKAGLEKRRFHDLRHTYAVTSLLAGDDGKTVQLNMGHHSAAFTLDQYGHVTETMRTNSANRMQAFINSVQ